MSYHGSCNHQFKYNSKVEIIQEWDGKIVNADTIISYFLDDLAQRKSEYKLRQTIE